MFSLPIALPRVLFLLWIAPQTLICAFANAFVIVAVVVVAFTVVAVVAVVVVIIIFGF